MKYCDFSSLKVGDKVWSSKDGWLKTIDRNCVGTILYPIGAINDDGYEFTFTKEGKEHFSDKYPTLFWNEFRIPEIAFIKPLPKLEVDTLVWVWNDDKSEKLLRFFSHFDEDGNIYTFDEGKDSSYNLNATISWNCWELYEKVKKLILIK